MKRKITWILLLTTFFMELSAQGETQRYEEFRNRIRSDYREFRRAVLDDYDTFLNGTWVEYRKFAGVKADDIPKPQQQPDGAPCISESVSQQIVPGGIMKIPAPVFPTPCFPSAISVPEGERVAVEFYGVRLELPVANRVVTLSSVDKEGFAAYWKTLKTTGFSQVAQLLVQHSEQMGLNDYMLYLLARKYAQAALRTAGQAEQCVLTQFLLVHCGFDARLGMSNGHPVLLLPFAGKIYSRVYIRQNGVNYYVFSDYPDQNSVVCSYELPPGAFGTGLLNFTFLKGGIRLPMDAHRYSFTDGVLKIEGNVNANLIRLLADLPQTDNLLYAQSVPDRVCRQEVLASLSAQLKGKSRREALEALLHFVQYAFRYATDNEQFGYEKPFFFEETLYYPMCDCEDRTVFFSYLVRELLRLDCHLLDYPGHMATAVAVEGAVGHHYFYKGTAYYVADPTYMGAKVGMCMPDYRNAKPELLIW